MQTRENRRGYEEHFVSGRHINLNDLKQEAQHLENQYLYKENIPNSPKPEFHVTRLKHDTDQDGLSGIRTDEGFRVPYEASDDPHAGVLLWWSLAVGHEEVKSAEKRLLQQKFSNLTDDEVAMHPSFLYKFTSSPAFSEKSRLGSYRFTFNLEDVLEAYSQQFCSGDQPVMRVYETVLYKQEVQHTVLVHSPVLSPANQKLFSEYPLLTDDPNAVCVYRDGRFIWRPYAMSETHRYELMEMRERNRMDATMRYWKQFYIWDNVAIALHVDKEVLEFDADQLRGNLKFCHHSEPAIGTFDSFEEATNQVTELWPDYDSPLEEECSLEQHFTDLRLVLVGRTGSGKSSSGNIILGRDAFSTGGAAAGNAQCCPQTKKVFDWKVTIIDTPGLSETREVKTEIKRCVDMLEGPHAFLLVIKMGPQISDEQDAVKQMEEIFGENIWRYTYVVLTYDNQLEMEVQIREENKTELKKILPGGVEDRCYVLKDKQQVWDLLDEVAKTVIQDLRLVLVGRTGSGKSTSGNIILARDAFSTGGAAASSSSGNIHCCLQMEKVFDWEVTIVDTPGLSEKLEIQKEILKCIAMSAPGPHAFLLVIKVGPQINEEQDTVRQMEEIFGENVWSHTFVVLTDDNKLEMDVQILEENKTELKKILPSRVKDRCYVLNNNQQVWDLLDEVAKMAVENKVYSCKDRVIQDLRLVLVGRTGSGKSSSGNIILARDAFSTGGAAASSSSGNAQCCLQMKKVFHWKVTVVETPGFSETPEVKTEIRRCVDMLSPGPHAFLLVIKVGPQMDEEQDTVRQMEEIFGENVWNHTFIVLTYDDQSEMDVELQLYKTKAKLKKILRVGDRYYELNINSSDFLQGFLSKVEKRVAENRRRFYSVQDRARKRKIIEVDGANTD
ncbi:GTPase IMAP family member 8-like [Acanthochromis polyacanthus]|uniref:GTPase IMAP family member 8-like n=1 Tax=Acanthochromis polyacanthus TaxID=80966 RepID=UPI00223453CC|nr:GTPase IMAP family member 8-like [Acanthochromis polyacanthus]